MNVLRNVPLEPLNSLRVVAKAKKLLRVTSEQDVLSLLADLELGAEPTFVLGGGSNVVLTGDVRALVLKVEIMGRRLVQETDRMRIVEAGAGENWHELVRFTIQRGWPGLENLAMIPGSVGGSPVQNIGAYGVELQDRFDSLDAIDLVTGKSFTLNAAQCAFGYRDSVFKHTSDFGLAGRALITRVRFALPKPWKPVLGYLDLMRKVQETGIEAPTPQQVFDWVCAIRSAKLPDPAVLGNVGSFFKNPTVTPEQCADIIERDPKVVHYPMADGSIKLAAGWLIDSCGWKGKSVGHAAVYERQALVLVNRGGATGGEVLTLAKAIQTSVYERFGIRLEPEPVVV
ncbi:MAG: UDP-N-acetylmuramate dehydrogenase [Burkholderiales bacterium]